MKYYWDIYKQFFQNSWAQALSFRTNFTVLVLIDLSLIASAVLSADFIYDHIQQIGGWDKNQFLFFLSFILCINGLDMAFFTHNYWMFPDHLRTGEMDFSLLRPGNALFSNFLRYARPSTFLALPLSFGLLLWFGCQLELSWHQWAMAVPLMALGLIQLVLLEIFICLWAFWTIEGDGINFIRMELMGVSRYPYFIYQKIWRSLLLILIPILLAASGPVYFIFNHQNWTLLAGMILAIPVELLVVRAMWNIGVRRYESASS